jgi:hypothetical protein
MEKSGAHTTQAFFYHSAEDSLFSPPRVGTQATHRIRKFQIPRSNRNFRQALVLMA